MARSVSVRSLLARKVPRIMAVLAWLAAQQEAKDTETIDFVEVFAGQRALSRAFQAMAYTVRSFEICLDPTHDFLSDEGQGA